MDHRRKFAILFRTDAKTLHRIWPIAVGGEHISPRIDHLDRLLNLTSGDRSDHIYRRRTQNGPESSADKRQMTTTFSEGMQR